METVVAAAKVSYSRGAAKCGGEVYGIWPQTVRVQSLPLTSATCMTLDKLFKLSVSSFVRWDNYNVPTMKVY